MARPLAVVAVEAHHILQRSRIGIGVVASLGALCSQHFEYGGIRLGYHGSVPGRIAVGGFHSGLDEDRFALYVSGFCGIDPGRENQ